MNDLILVSKLTAIKDNMVYTTKTFEVTLFFHYRLLTTLCASDNELVKEWILIFYPHIVYKSFEMMISRMA